MAVFLICVLLQAAGIQVTVTRVIDGDTIIVRLEDGKEERVRFWAIDAEELSRKHPSGRALAAKEFVRRACEGKQVTLLPPPYRSVFPRDRYHRLVARIMVCNQNLEGCLCFLGLASISNYRS